MKKLLLILAVCSCISYLYGQANSVALKTGDAAPPLTGIVRWLKGDSIGSFEKGKIYVVEFGATWCSPCAAAIPHLSAMASKYAPAGVSVISIFVQENYSSTDAHGHPAYQKNVSRYIARRRDQIQYNVALDGSAGIVNNNWIIAASKSGVPHIFVVDKSSRICWIGSNPVRADSVVEAVLHDETKIEKTSAVVSSADNNPVQTQDRDLLFTSGLWAYHVGEPATDPVYIENYKSFTLPKHIAMQGKIDVRGVSLRRLYYMAYSDTLWNAPHQRQFGTDIYFDTVSLPFRKRSYGKYWFKPLLRMTDSTAFDARSGSSENRYTYYLEMPAPITWSKHLRKKMRSDLEYYFGYRVNVETASMPVWNLTAAPQAIASLKSKNSDHKHRMYEAENGDIVYKNAEMRDIILILEARFGHYGDGDLTDRPGRQPPFFDATGITGLIDFTLDGELMARVYSQRGDASVFEEFKNYLQKMGIVLKKSRKTMKVVVINDQEKL